MFGTDKRNRLKFDNKDAQVSPGHSHEVSYNHAYTRVFVRTILQSQNHAYCVSYQVNKG